MKNILLVLFVCLSANIYSQTYNEALRNDKTVIKESSELRQKFYRIFDDDKDTLWLTYMEKIGTNDAQSRIISFDKNLNICSNFMMQSPLQGSLIHSKINDKYYSVYHKYSNTISEDYSDTIHFICYDKNGNILIQKPIWVNNNIDTFLIGTDFKLLTLSDKNFLMVSEVQFPYTKIHNSQFGVDAIRFILFDTMANIINTNIYSQRLNWWQMSMCEMGNHIILDKVGQPVDTGSFSTFGTSFFNKNTLVIEDSIPRKWFLDTLASGENSHSIENLQLARLNDSIYVGIYEFWGHPIIRMFNKNTKQEIHKITYRVEGGDDNIPTADDKYWADVYGGAIGLQGSRFVYKNTDSVYAVYKVRIPQNSIYENGWIELLNFGINGNINFVYRFSLLDSTHAPYITGLKAYDDGSLVITANNSIQGITETWLIKFNPNGLVSLSNVESGERASLRVYPNPAKDFVLVDIEADRFVEADIEIYDLGGRMVKKSKLTAKVGNRIDVSSLKAGVYSYRVALNGKGVSGKIVIGE